MIHPMLAVIALIGFGVLPAAAQDLGEFRLRGLEAVLSWVEQASASGCRLCTASLTMGVNRATAVGSWTSLQFGTDGSGGCQPLVSTQVTAGVNLALGRGSQVGQSIEVRSPRGLRATNTVARSVDYAADSRRTATQRFLAQTGR